MGIFRLIRESTLLRDAVSRRRGSEGEFWPDFDGRMGVRPEYPVGTSHRARGESRDEADAVGGGSEPSVNAAEDALSTRRGGPGPEVEVVALAAAAQAARRS